MRYASKLKLYATLLGLVLAWPAAAQLKSHVVSSEDLEYGPVLFEFYQQDYFYGLVEDATLAASGNRVAGSNSARLLGGSMMLRYALPEQAEAIFTRLLSNTKSSDIRNRAWYHLARLYYNRSDRTNANRALGQITGELPRDLHVDYHYLASLIKNDGSHLQSVSEAALLYADESPEYSYLLFNLAVTQLRGGNVFEAVMKLEQLAGYSGTNREMLALADRAKHGLSQMATQAKDLPRAWRYLTGIRTTGLYSNRALLSYAWTAINMKLFQEAIPALQILDQRSIAIPEVQEGKVLLAHLYEQEGSPRKALKSNVLAEKAFKQGLADLSEARRIIAMRDVPREFIENLESIMDETDWYSAHASVDYRKLTPFLIDLMASHPFNETLKDLIALYALEDNLNYWLSQTSEHQLVLANSADKSVETDMAELLARSEGINERLRDQKTEIQLLTLTLEDEERERFDVLIENAEHDLVILEDKIRQLRKDKKAYVQPKGHKSLVKANHQRITKQLSITQRYIASLEPVVRKLVRVELDKHEERMRYYWAQSRLAKARLFDSTLLQLENNKAPAESQR
ncbi:tetratricopeptide repeat protein [Teredinibacter franksiae]|uniref:tetratricopeptide repeat protein n=1 Tax=Teredinibacter franksiae TaxID=2761453 RepID=UPI001FEBD2B4|nr:hypothetical protein [Teredinibacter franksiae]